MNPIQSNPLQRDLLKSLTANCFKGLRWDPTYRIYITYVAALKTFCVIRQT